MKSGIQKGVFLACMVSAVALFCLSQSQAQTPAPAAGAAPAAAPARGGRAGRGPAEFWYINKGKGGVYNKPMRPLWKLSDLLRMHSGQNNWREQIINDNLQDVTYNSAAPGSKVIPRLHIETAVAFVIIKGEMHFQIEGQQPVTATRGGIVNVMPDTIYSYDAGGSDNALWVEIHPYWYQTEYPATQPPPPDIRGTTVVKTSFPHTPAPYTGNNKPYFNLFEALAACQPVNNVVNEDHIHVGPLLGYVNGADNKCDGSTGNIGSGPLKPGDPKFNPDSTFGHLHHGVVEWWVVQSGQIRGQFEGTGEFHAVEGDVLYAAPDMWHQMAAEAPSGPSVRTAMGAYQITNMNNTGGGQE